MKHIIILTFLLPFILSFATQNDSCNLNTNNKCDSIVVKGRIIEESKFKNPKYICPVKGVVVIFLDYKYKGLLAESSNNFLKDTMITSESNYVITDNNGCFECKLARNNYIVTSSYIGYKGVMKNVIPDGKTVDLGDIELINEHFDVKDDTLRITNWSKIKLFFRKCRFL